jgi:hypothetical protein
MKKGRIGRKKNRRKVKCPGWSVGQETTQTSFLVDS